MSTDKSNKNGDVLDARGQLKDPNAMDIGYSGEEDWTWETELAISMLVPLEE